MVSTRTKQFLIYIRFKVVNDVKDKANIQKWELEQSPDGYKATS